MAGPEGRMRQAGESEPVQAEQVEVAAVLLEPLDDVSRGNVKYEGLPSAARMA